MSIRIPLNPVFGRIARRSESTNSAVVDADNTDTLDASDVWLVPSNGRVVFDERGNTTWQWPDADDPFVAKSSARDFDASNLSIVEPSEIRRSQRPWLHESEKAGRVSRVSAQTAQSTPALATRKR